MTVAEMKNKISKAVDEVKAIANRVKAANRDYTDDEAKQLDSIQAQIDHDIKQLDALRAEDNVNAKMAGMVGAKVLMEKMKEAGIGGDSTSGREIVSHNGQKAFFLEFGSDH